MKFIKLKETKCVWKERIIMVKEKLSLRQYGYDIYICNAKIIEPYSPYINICGDASMLSVTIFELFKQTLQLPFSLMKASHRWLAHSLAQ